MQENTHQPAGQERRNYYRILNVQPDAPIEIIRNNYRTLMQKLRLHPDLGGLTQQASSINEAYNVLRDPVRRADYDTKLLQEHGLATLSQGNLSKQREPGSQQRKDSTGKDRHGNQRNFYRILNVQPDAPAHIIKTSYLSLKKQNGPKNDMYNEAYSILGNIEKRKIYDRLLIKHSHSEAVEFLVNSARGHFQQINNAPANSKAGTDIRVRARLEQEYGKADRSPYRPVITQYCQFCKTPHSQSPCEDTAPLCNECQSPLFPPSSAFLDQSRRDIVRMAQRHGVCHFFTTWPGKKDSGKIADLSPLGMQLQTASVLEKGQVLKLDSEDFKAVGVVTHTHNDFDADAFSSFAVGIKFITVNFNKLKGQFFSASA